MSRLPQLSNAGAVGARAAGVAGVEADTDFVLLCDRDGNYLSGTGQSRPAAGDDCLWQFAADGSRLVCAVGDTSLSGHCPPGSAQFEVTGGDGSGSEFGSQAGRRFALQAGPTRRPSAHLAELQDTGFTVLERLIDPASLARIKARVEREKSIHYGDELPTDGRFGVANGVAWSVEVARAVTHPVAMWLLQAFLETDDIHYCHPPSVTTMRPAGKLLGEFPEGGWHSDYPYHPGIFPNDDWPTDRVYGVQFNLCIDPFRADNAATQYLPGSHRRGRWPHRAFNQGGTRMGVGQHQDVRQMEAPAGSALVYDSRMWHRACDELNVSGEHRVAILNAVTPDWVVPMTPRSKAAAHYQASSVPAALNARERTKLHALAGSPTPPAPIGVPSLQRRQRG